MGNNKGVHELTLQMLDCVVFRLLYVIVLCLMGGGFDVALEG